MHDLRLGKGQRHAHKTCKALTQRVIPALHMSSLSCLLAHGRVLLLRDDGSIDIQKVRKALALTILLRNGLPQPQACFFASIPNGIRHHLTCLTAQSDPDPRVVRLFEYKRPQFVQFQCRGRGILSVWGEQGGPQRRKLFYFFLIQLDTVARETPKVRVRPRRLLRSW